MAKKDNNLNHIIAIIAIIAFIYGGSHGWFQSTTYNIEGDTISDTNIINQLNNATIEGEPDCEMRISETSACVGDMVTMTIIDGKNTNCFVYYKYNNNQWSLAGVFTTDPFGVLELQRAATVSGTYRFAAICGQCLTNFVQIEIVDCDDDNNDNDDNGDNDGGPITACSSPWPPVDSQADCGARTATCSSDKYCKFYPETAAVPGHCACTVPTTCDDKCRMQGLSSGTCHGATNQFGDPVKNPCANVGTHYSAFDSLCPISYLNLHDWCCCV